jgi:hypothetical protein
MPAATDQFSKYLRAAPTTPAQLERVADFLMDSGRSIYNWQNYQMWVALTDKKHQSKPLSLFASQVVATNEDSPSRAGASLYLGASGDSSGKELVANRFQHHTFAVEYCSFVRLRESPIFYVHYQVISEWWAIWRRATTDPQGWQNWISSFAASCLQS